MARLGTVKLETSNKVIEVPVFSLDEAGDDVSNVLRVQTQNGPGFIPLTDVDDAEYPQLRVLSSSGIKAVHDEPTLIQKADITGTYEYTGSAVTLDLEGKGGTFLFKLEGAGGNEDQWDGGSGGSIEGWLDVSNYDHLDIIVGGIPWPNGQNAPWVEGGGETLVGHGGDRLLSASGGGSGNNFSTRILASGGGPSGGSPMNDGGYDCYVSSSQCLDGSRGGGGSAGETGVIVVEEYEP